MIPLVIPPPLVLDLRPRLLFVEGDRADPENVDLMVEGEGFGDGTGECVVLVESWLEDDNWGESVFWGRSEFCGEIFEIRFF
jgi:hypothetical protein